MPSTRDELEQIERSARFGGLSENKGGSRRGSSMFSGADAVKHYKEEMGISSKSSKSSELLEDFPKRNASPPSKHTKPLPTQSFYTQPAPVKPPANMSRPSPGTAVKRGSVALKPMSGLGGLVDFDDSDFDDSDDEGYNLPGAPMPGSANAVGGPNHRPLVGGFAAAAYEAARAHHYSNVNKGQQSHVSRNRGPPPSI